MSQDLSQVELFTDGACRGNPGQGGYAAVLVCGPHRKEVSGGFRRTTNARSELQAVIAGLEALKRPCQVTLYADSQYVVKGALEWSPNWIANGWRKANGKPVENQDLWQRLLELIEPHQVNFIWVRGHDGHPHNEQADALARAAAGQPDLLPDTGYEEANDAHPQPA